MTSASLPIQQLPTYIQQRIPSAIVPVQYTAAVRAIVACRQIEDAKNWSDKADALAAWAKIYSDDKASVEAKRLKLHAFRRMYQLADEISPRRLIGGREKDGTRRGSTGGPLKLLRIKGLKLNEARIASRIGRMDEREFKKILNRPKPPGIHSIGAIRLSGSDAYRILVGGREGHSNDNAARFAYYCSRYPAKMLARGLDPGELIRVRKIIATIADWCAELEHYLPKMKATERGSRE